MRINKYTPLEVERSDLNDRKAGYCASFREIMEERSMTPNELANLSGVTPSTVYSMMDDRRKELSINVINKLCGGVEIRLADFFDSPLFDELDLELDPPAYETLFFD